MPSPHRSDGAKMKIIMKKCFPECSKELIRWLLVTATEIYYERTSARIFSKEGVLSVIRWSRTKIREGAKLPLPLIQENYFLPEPERAFRDPRLDIEPNLFFLTPNEHWSGKGSAGKNSFS